MNLLVYTLKNKKYHWSEVPHVELDVRNMSSLKFIFKLMNLQEFMRINN